MKHEDVLDVLKQNYTQTVVLYPFEGEIQFYHQNIGSDLSSYRKHDAPDDRMEARCTITEQGALRYCSWSRNEEDNNEYYDSENSDDSESDDDSNRGDIVVENFMAEIYRIYKKAEKDRDVKDDFILEAFSSALASVVEQKIFKVPTEWEHGIRNSIILPVFKKAGLIQNDDHTSKLIFDTDLNIIVHQLQDGSGNDSKSSSEGAKMEGGQQYILLGLDPVWDDNTLLMKYSCFKTSNLLKANKIDYLKGKGDNYGSRMSIINVNSNNRDYSLTFIKSIKKDVLNFLRTKNSINVLPADDLDSVEAFVNLLIEIFLKRYGSKLKSKEELNNITMSKTFPFEDIDVDNTSYKSVIQSEKSLKSISMFEMYNIMFRKNEAVIKELLEHATCDSNYSTHGRKTVIVTANICISYDTDFYYGKSNIGFNSLTGRYINCIFYLILKLESDYQYKTLAIDDDKMAGGNKYFYFDPKKIAITTAWKFLNSAALLFPHLPLCFLNLSSSQEKESILSNSQFTKRSTPEYIVKIDVKLFEPSTFSCVQLDYHGKKAAVKSTLTNEKCEDNSYMSLPALSTYFKTKSTDGSFYPERIYITARLLGIINTHFEYALDYFSKYDRQKSKNEKLFTVKEEELDSKDKSTLNEHDGHLLLFRSFDNLIPEIKLELEKSGREEETKLVEISQQCYIRVLLMIYLGVLKYNISALLEEKIGKKGDAADENTIIGYTILVDAFFLHTYLKDLHSSSTELAIASGFAKNEEDCKSNVRVITDREEQLLPILEQKLGKSLPLKSFYVHGRLYERYLHITLNQVVIEGLLSEQNSKNIVIKSKVITMPYLLDMICDNLWDAAQNSNCIVPGANCKHLNEGHATLQDFSLTELEGFKDKILSCAKKLFFTDSINKEYIGISIPISSICSCKLYFGREDIFDLGIIPAIKYTVSVFAGAITNEDMFGLYGIRHFFATLNYFSSVFHRSYQKYFEYNLKRLIDINLEKKRLKIPYTVFPEPLGGLLQPATNKMIILADSFLYGNILQVSSETYGLRFYKINSKTRKESNSQIYYKRPDTREYKLLEKNRAAYLLKRTELVYNTTTTKRIFHAKGQRRSNLVKHQILGEITKVLNQKSSHKLNLHKTNIVGKISFGASTRIPSYDDTTNTCPDEAKYAPIYFNTRFFNHLSAIQLSFRTGTGFIKTSNGRLIVMPEAIFYFNEQLTLTHTQLND